MKLISGVEPTPQRVQHVQAIAHTLGFAPNDPMMAILISLDCYYGAFSEMPGRVQQVANLAVAGAEQQSKAAVQLAIGSYLKSHQVEAAVTAAFEKAAAAGMRKATETQHATSFKWAAIGAGGAALALAIFASVLYSSGKDAGVAASHQASVELNDLAKWANSEQGRLAHSLAQTGSLELLANCSIEGYEKKKQDGRVACFPSKDGKGWWIK